MSEEHVIPSAQVQDQSVIFEDAELTPESVMSEEEIAAENSVRYSEKSLDEIVSILEDLVKADYSDEMARTAEALKSAFYRILRRDRDNDSAGGVSDGADTDEQSAERKFKELYQQYRNKRSAYTAEQERQKELNLECKLAVIEEIRQLVDRQEDINLTFPAFRDLQSRWKEIGPVPQNRTRDVWESYQHQVELFYDFVKINNELRDLDFRRNMEIKVGLCEQAEALENVSSVVDAFKELQVLHEKWRETGPVAREFREDLWNRFREATAAVNRKHQNYFETLKKERAENLERKTALCEQAEAIAGRQNVDAGEWNVLSKQMEALQEEWKKIGFASRKDNQRIYERFRQACDMFYGRKREFYAEFKNVMQRNLELKEAICEKAEALVSSSEWKSATDMLIKLQKEWKTIGPVARKQSDAVWKRFRAACDAFFERKEKHFSGVDSEHMKNLELKRALVDEVKAYVMTGNREQDMAAMKAFQERWRQIGFVPFRDKESVQDEFRKAMDVHFSSIRSQEGEKRMNRFTRRIQEIQSNVSGAAGVRILRNEREKLLQRYRRIENDIMTLENNSGFFAKSSNADSFLADISRKIEEARKELEQIEEKIKIIDKQFQENEQ